MKIAPGPRPRGDHSADSVSVSGSLSSSFCLRFPSRCLNYSASVGRQEVATNSSHVHVEAQVAARPTTESSSRWIPVRPAGDAGEPARFVPSNHGHRNPAPRSRVSDLRALGDSSDGVGRRRGGAVDSRRSGGDRHRRSRPPGRPGRRRDRLRPCSPETALTSGARAHADRERRCRVPRHPLAKVHS